MKRVKLKKRLVFKDGFTRILLLIFLAYVLLYMSTVAGIVGLFLMSLVIVIIMAIPQIKNNIEYETWVVDKK